MLKWKKNCIGHALHSTYWRNKLCSSICHWKSRRSLKQDKCWVPITNVLPVRQICLFQPTPPPCSLCGKHSIGRGKQANYWVRAKSWQGQGWWVEQVLLWFVCSRLNFQAARMPKKLFTCTGKLLCKLADKFTVIPTIAQIIYRRQKQYS